MRSCLLLAFSLSVSLASLCLCCLCSSVSQTHRLPTVAIPVLKAAVQSTKVKSHGNNVHDIIIARDKCGHTHTHKRKKTSKVESNLRTSQKITGDYWRLLEITDKKTRVETDPQRIFSRLVHDVSCPSHHGDSCEGGVSCPSCHCDGRAEGELEVIFLLGEQTLKGSGIKRILVLVTQYSVD